MPPSRALSLPKRLSRRPILLLTLLFAVLLLLNFVLRLPTWRVADWGQFAFYDPGTVLKGDLLLQKGYVPTIDFGYTHGLLSLLYGRIGFALFGRTPAAFLALTLLTEMVMAWALARIFVACRASIAAIVIFCLALPMAIMPAYLTLTHPLEAMLILLALAAHAEEKRSQSLAILTVCLFVKPSMAYVYGFLLVLLIVWRHRRINAIVRELLPAVLTLIFLLVGLSLWMGPRPVLATLLPTTGAATYAATGFGFFATSGRAFWLRPTLADEFLTPAAAFLVATFATVAGALWTLSRPRSASARGELLFTLGFLQAAFLLLFYGWTGSWTYYAYLPMLGLALLLTLIPFSPAIRMFAAALVAVLLLASHDELVGDVYNGWHFKTRSAATANLWADPEVFAQWQEALAATHGQCPLLMSNGYLPDLPVIFPDAWFPEPGIPTPTEIARVHHQAEAAPVVILWWEYRQFDLWNSPAFADFRSQFHQAFKNERFTVLERNTQ